MHEVRLYILLLYWIVDAKDCSDNDSKCTKYAEFLTAQGIILLQ